ncbi:MAG: hypothetical protein JST80_09595 [Bdellovibrionales bacterium]|nr:hypothetical protein [Bdellovibrionales bacterium]
MKIAAALLSLFVVLALPAYAQGPSADLTNLVKEVTTQVDAIAITAQDIQAGTVKALESISKINLNIFKKKDFEDARKELVPLIYKARIGLRKKMQDLDAEGKLDEATARSVERTIRYMRGIEDYLGYVDSDQKKTKPLIGKAIRFLTPAGMMAGYESLLPADNTLISPAFDKKIRDDRSNLMLKSGDLILSRGSASTSSAIARLADEDTQFSHVALVYIDPITKKGYLIEAHIELGVLTSPIETWLKDGKKRSAVYRYKDTALAKTAAEKMFRFVSDYKAKTGKNIPYDFSFNMNDGTSVFCSEVVRIAYALADENTHIPQYASSLNPKNRLYLDQLGIQEKKSFIPADIEADPRFTPIVEWRDFPQIKDSWLRDAITTKIYEWMERDTLKYRPNALQRFAAKALVGLRHTPICEWAFKDRLADNASSEVVGVMFAIESLYAKVMNKLLAKEAVVIAARGTPYTLLEAEQALEQMRQEAPEIFSKLLR